MREFEAQAVSGYFIEWTDGKPSFGETFDNGGVGWHYAYDKSGRGNFIYNDDPESEYYL